MKDKKKPGPGGKRKGAGAKKGEPKKAVGQRVPVRFHKQIVQMVKDEVQRLQRQGVIQGLNSVVGSNPAPEKG